jgi:hypothetical protein
LWRVTGDSGPNNAGGPLRTLLPKAVAWAEQQSGQIRRFGEPLTDDERGLARRMGVANPGLIRVLTVEEIPRPEDPVLLAFAESVGFLDQEPNGLTLGYGIFLRSGTRANRLISHECRHVFQYEQMRTIENFLRAYLAQILEFGYWKAPLEEDAYANETDA